MNSHPYLRAYMAGILLPSWVLLVALVFARIHAELEGFIVFPMAVVPNLWGLWNVLYVRFGLRRHIPLGAFGALLPLLLAPLGIVLASALHIEFYAGRLVAMLIPVVMAIYFVVWKHVVGFFNRVVGLP